MPARVTRFSVRLKEVEEARIALESHQQSVDDDEFQAPTDDSTLTGNSRVYDPVQAAKFASEGDIAVRSEVPILPSWKEYKNKEEHVQGFIIRLSVSACLHSLCYFFYVYELKKKYFVGIPADQVLKTSPVDTMTDAQWCELVEKWPASKNKVASARAEPEDADSQEQASTDELDAVEAFRVCHTNRNNVISGADREALESIEALRAEAVAAGTSPLPSGQVISKVLSQGGSNSYSSGTFLKNAGILDCSSRSCSRGEDALRSQLATEVEGSVALLEKIEVMKKDTTATRVAFLKMKLDQEEVIRRLSNNPRISGTILSLDP
ncbi:hypothetical protein HU200_056265 [Digitaria exilis]|uniref:Uncharacterized protein n=1 Tax=Digitaria exilis TaxID=1010633 RepID=A0A835AHY0_9POAL|nr:hypothetical protein HU200_056265 [Digitaria exilis]